MEIDNSLVYNVLEIQRMLKLSRSGAYLWLDEIYKAQMPFRVIKIGKLYKIPKESFDNWFAGNCKN